MEVLNVQNQYWDQRYSSSINTHHKQDWPRSTDRQTFDRDAGMNHYKMLEDQYQYTIKDKFDELAVNELSSCLMIELRLANTRHLTCTGVSLPNVLTRRIASDIVHLSNREPRGIRGGTIFVEYEAGPSNIRRIAKLQLDMEMVSIFEVYLTLRQNRSGWTSLLPQFIKGLSRTITIGPDYTINKRKLYSHDSN